MDLPNTFLNEAYGDPWKKKIKNYADNKSIDPQTKYNRLRELITLRETRRQGNPSFNGNSKKKLQLDNRIGNIKKQVYQTQNPLADPRTFDDKAGVVIVFADGKALYCVDNEGKLGFPKGDIDYKLRDINDITSVYREEPQVAALRELEEETGFYIDGNTLRRRVNGETLSGSYTIIHRKEGRKTLNDNNKTKAYYYILYLQEASNAREGPDLSQLTPIAQREHITAYRIENQNEKGKSYNLFSQQKFPHERSPPPRGGKRKTRKAKRKGRKTMRSRG